MCQNINWAEKSTTTNQLPVSLITSRRVLAHHPPTLSRRLTTQQRAQPSEDAGQTRQMRAARGSPAPAREAPRSSPADLQALASGTGGRKPSFGLWCYSEDSFAFRTLSAIPFLRVTVFPHAVGVLSPTVSHDQSTQGEARAVHRFLYDVTNTVVQQRSRIGERIDFQQ